MIRILLFLLLFTQPSQLTAQPDSRFRPFDWTLYRGSGSITSITEGFTFAYIGTEMGGLKRFNIFSQNFDEPITIAQGLKDNNITCLPSSDNPLGELWKNMPFQEQEDLNKFNSFTQ